MADPANVKLWWPLGSEDTVCKMLAKNKLFATSKFQASAKFWMALDEQKENPPMWC